MAMQNLKITISELGKDDIVRDMTDDEIAALDELTKAKAEVLAKLGLTKEEAAALLG